jgi:hypothetical protein
MPRTPSIPGAAFLLLAAGCVSDAGDSRTPGSASLALDSPDRAIAMEAPLLYRIGGFDAEGWEQFGRVGPVGFDAAGHLYILDAQAMQVTVVDRSGTRIRSLGRPGGGPGEFGAPLGMAVFPEGRVVISDIGNRGFVVFGSGGAFEQLVPFEGLNFATTILPVLPDRVLQSGGGIRMALGGPGGPAPEAPTTRPIQLFSLETGAPATVWDAWLMPPPDVPGGPPATITGPGGQRITLASVSPLRAFEPALHVQPLPNGGLAVADSVGYRIRILHDGDVTTVVERPISPSPVTPAVQEAERERRLEALASGASRAQVRVMGGAGGGSAEMDVSAMERGRIEGMVFADEVPVIARMAADWAGRLWVERSGPLPGENGPTDIVTPDGRYLGTIPPDGLRIPSAFGPDGLVAYLTQDEYEVAVVEVRQLPDQWR